MSIKRLTDERIAALIDMIPLNETIVDIKSALVELQERRKATGEQAGLFIRVNNMFFQVATAGNDCDESVRDQAIQLYTEPQIPDLKSEKSSLPVPKFDNEYIRTRLQAFNDTDEIVGWLSELADEYQEAEYDLKEAATSLCEMRADLKDFGNELIRLQGNQAPVRQPASNSAAIADLAKIISTAGNDPSEITDAVWAAGYRKPDRTEEEAINLAIDTFTDSRYNGIPDDAWPKTYDEILQCELNEIINEVTWSYFSPENIANCLIEAGYSLEDAND